MAKVKGAFLSLGFFILLLVFFSFALLIADSFRFSKERVAESIFLERVHTLDESVQQGFRDIFNKNSGIAISKGNDIIFSEWLPSVNDTMFKNNITNFTIFVNSSYPINLDKDLINKELALWIKPHNIKYYHVDYGDDIIKVEHESYNFNKYIVNLKTSLVLDGTSCIGSGNSNRLDVSAEGGLSTSCNSNSKEHVGLYDENDALIASVDLDNNMLTIDAELSVLVTTTIDNLNNLGVVDIMTDKVMFINYTEYEYAKNGSIRVV